MGFDHCYLVGFDYTHLPGRVFHWHEKGEGVIRNQLGYNREFFEIAKEFIDITTITIDGGSEFIRSETYEQLTGLLPRYRENTELLTTNQLQALSKWPGYNTF